MVEEKIEMCWWSWEKTEKCGGGGGGGGKTIEMWWWCTASLFKVGIMTNKLS